MQSQRGLYWPLMNAEIKDTITKCAICNTLKLEQYREPIKQQDVADRPWSKVGTDLFMFNNQAYIVTIVLILLRWID